MLTEDQLPHEAPKNVFTRVLGNRTPAFLRPHEPVPKFIQYEPGQVSASPDHGVIPETIDIRPVTQRVRAILTEVEAIQEQGERIDHKLQEINNTENPSTQELAVRFMDIASSAQKWSRVVADQVDTVNADSDIWKLKRIGASIASLDSAIAAIREQTSVHERDYGARAIAAVSLALSEEWTRRWEEQLREGNPHPMVESIDTMEEARRIVKEIWNQRESEQAPASIPQVPRASRTPWPVEDDNVLQIQDQGRAHINLDPDISDDDIAALELLLPSTDDEQRDDESGDDEADREPTVPLPLAPRAPEHADNAGGDQNTEHVRLEDYLPVQMEAQVRAMISHLRFESRVAAQQAARFDVQMGTFTSIADPALERLTQDRDAIPDSADVLELYQSLMKSIEVLTAMRTADPEMREEIAQSILTQINHRSTTLRAPQRQESDQGQSTDDQRELALLTFLREQIHAYALPNANVDDILHAIQTRMESFASDEPIISPDTMLSDVEGLESILTTRIVDTLRNHQIRTIGQLVTLTREALNSILQSEGQGRNLLPISIEDYLRLVTTLREYPPPSSETLEAVNRAATEVRAMGAGTPPDTASSTPLIPSGCLPRIFGPRVWKRVEAMLRKRKKLESPAQPTTPQPPELSQGPTAVSATPLNIDDLEVMGVSVAPLEPVRAPAAPRPPHLPTPPAAVPRAAVAGEGDGSRKEATPPNVEELVTQQNWQALVDLATNSATNESVAVQSVKALIDNNQRDYVENVVDEVSTPEPVRQAAIEALIGIEDWNFFSILTSQEKNGEPLAIQALEILIDNGQYAWVEYVSREAAFPAVKQKAEEVIVAELRKIVDAKGWSSLTVLTTMEEVSNPSLAMRALTLLIKHGQYDQVTEVSLHAFDRTVKQSAVWTLRAIAEAQQQKIDAALASLPPEIRDAVRGPITDLHAMAVRVHQRGEQIAESILRQTANIDAPVIGSALRAYARELSGIVHATDGNLDITPETLRRAGAEMVTAALLDIQAGADLLAFLGIGSWGELAAGGISQITGETLTRTITQRVIAHGGLDQNIKALLEALLKDPDAVQEIGADSRIVKRTKELVEPADAKAAQAKAERGAQPMSAILSSDTLRGIPSDKQFISQWTIQEVAGYDASDEGARAIMAKLNQKSNNYVEPYIKAITLAKEYYEKGHIS